jgi:CHAT domain-containing protein/tetratricopeptide (TPR) repeat protein
LLVITLTTQGSTRPGLLRAKRRGRGALLLLVTITSACVAALLPASQAVAAREAVRGIGARAPVAQEISGGAAHEYEIELLAGQQIIVQVAKGDLHLSVTLSGSDGRVLEEFVSRRFGPLRVSHITKAAGTLRLEVRSLESDAAGRRYELRVERAGNASALDRKDQLAAAGYARAERLRADWTRKSLREAVGEYEKAAGLWRGVSRRRESAKALAALGETYFILGDYRPALDAFSRARALSRTAGDREAEAHALNQLGHIHASVGNKAKALEFSRRAQDCLRQADAADTVEQLRGEAQSLNNRGEVHYSLGELKEALDCFDGALNLWERAPDRRGQALAHINLGYAYTDCGDLSKAFEHYTRALSLWRAVDDRRGAALSQTALGAINSFLGKWQLALDAYREVLQILRSLGDTQSEAVVLNSVGQVYEDLSEPNMALDYYKRALTLNQENGNRGFEAVTQYYIGRAYRQSGDNERALDFYRQSLALSQRLGKRRVAAYAFMDIGAIYNSLKQEQFALDQYKEVLKFYREAGDRRGQANTLKTIGDIHYSSGDKRQALDYFEQYLSLSREASDRSGEATALYDIARTERDHGNLDAALGHITESLKIIETLRTQVASQQLRTSYFASIQKHYALYIALLMQMHLLNPEGGFAVAAFEASESARSRSLVETLLRAGDDVRLNANPELLERQRTLQFKLSSKALHLMRLRNSTLTEAGAEEIERELRGLTNEYHEVEALISVNSPRYASLTQPPPLRLEDLQAELRGDDVVMLEYALGEEKSHLWAVTSDSFASYELPERLKIEEAARRVYQLLSARGSGDADARYWREASALSRMLLGPVASRLGGKRLLIVADGALQYIPFEALPLPRLEGSDADKAGDDAGGDGPLVLKHEVVYLPSASTLMALRRVKSTPTGPRRSVFALADPVFDVEDPRLKVQPPRAVAADAAAPPHALSYPPGAVPRVHRLPSTQREAEEIVALARGDGTLVKGFAASRAAAQSDELNLYRIVHFATHSIVNSQHPELSGIVLSMVNERGEEQNGFLQLHDIYGLKLSADLVVLSACSTGLGKDVRGEGLVGLTRGFMYAGSPRVVASLWKVDDQASAELMVHFYRALLEEGLPPAEALRHSKALMWREGRWRSPHFWAAFVLQGEYRGGGGGGRLSRYVALGLAGAIMFGILGVLLGWRRVGHGVR